MGIMLSLVSARFMGTIESTRFARTAEAGMADILLIRSDAMLMRQARTLVTSDSARAEAIERPAETLRQLSLPTGWQVRGRSIDISSTGFCSGGRLLLIDPKGRRAEYLLSPPRCEPKRLSQ